MKKKGCRVPQYDRVQNEGKLWTKYVTNNTDVKMVSNAWAAAAEKFGRTGTVYYINFVQESGYTADVTIDNIWSTYHLASVDRKNGGIGAHLDDQKDTTIRLRLKGDNRVGCVHYSSDKGSGNQIIFDNGETVDAPGSITVADFPQNFKANHWNSAIGAADNPANTGDMSDGIVINSGVIFAGTTPEDNCTAIGGGGNNYGGVTINGGTVTAVVSSTGTAIGGGIGYGNKGGDTDVIINDGTVYAYNLGIQSDAGDGFTKFVPAAAIGGGGSKNAAGSLTANITITGGTVYAQSMGGAAIGGGCSANADGGPATINISGGTIIAKSTGGNYGNEKITPGVSIGGGTGKTRGGSVILNVSEKNSKPTILRTGSIGGGLATDEGAKIGNAKVTISGGDITGQVIMAAGANEKCEFQMTGGRIHGTDVVNGNEVTGVSDPKQDVKIEYLEKNGGAVWMQDPIGVTDITGGTIEECSAYLGGAVYMEGGTFILSGTGTIRKNNAKRIEGGNINQGYGGGVYISMGNAAINGGSINENTADIRGGGLYVNGGDVDVSGGSICKNEAGIDQTLTQVGRGGGVYLEDGNFTMTGGEISDNSANYRGGGIFLTKKPTLTAGTISGNKATDSGGGLCINGDELELVSPNMQIFGNTAANGGGVAVLNGNFILNGGAVGVEEEAANETENGGAAGGESETVSKANTATNGGGVYVKADGTGKANAEVLSGNIWYNKATNGGGIYLAEGEGDFKLNGADASISHNEATDGGGIYLYKNPLLNHGKIEQNTAGENGGGMFISGCLVTLKPENDVTITQNNAKNGAGIYISGSTESSGGPSGAESPGGSGSSEGVDATSSPSPDHKVGLLVAFGFKGTVKFTNNKAEVNGGAVCVNAGRFQLESDRITVTGNEAENGGGVAVLQGNFTMSAGAIGEKDGANTATNGGGVYVSNGEVWLKGGNVQYNEAADGGGAYVTGGKFYMIDGFLANNTANADTGNGGGAYVAGDFRMQGGTIGGEGDGNKAANGGGIFVNEGNVTIVYGNITHNSATQDGGGSYVSATNNKVNVVMLSGSLSNNQAGGNGGGMAVESSNSQEITVEIGCLLNHQLTNTNNQPTYPIKYEGEKYGQYKEFDNIVYEHKSCPKVEYNQAGKIGGGFYMNSDASTLSFYCVEETQNIAQGADTAGMDVVGGKVIIGDENYHNYEHDSNKTEGKQNVPWGYISMDDATMVNGGQVDIYGDMTNPIFKEEVTVDIENQNDHFLDHRRAHTDEKRYKVHYIENFQGTGLYQAFQYDDSNCIIEIKGALYSHPGYTILGWYTKAKYDPTVEDEKHKFYPVGESFNLSDKDSVPQMGANSIPCDICGSNKNDENLLELYAIWEANGYTVVFDPNVPEGSTYTGTMKDQIHQYGVEQELTPNTYKYKGHIFNGWATKPDGTGTRYEDGQKVLNLTDKNGVKVMLYAQWTPCDHKDPERWSYDVINGEKTLRRICSCGGQTLTATLSAEDTVYDGNTHPATLVCDDEAAWGNDKPTVEYTGEWLKDGLNHDGSTLELKDGIPLHAGVYKASITKPDENSGGNTQIPVTAFVAYTIDKADQSAPEKPTYSVEQNVLTVNKIGEDPHKLVAADITQEAKAQYRLSYYVGHKLESTEWKTMPEGRDELAENMDNAWTSYIVEVRYEELNDYYASEIKRADAEYHYDGNVTVKIICDEGINYVFAPNEGNDLTKNGATLTLSTREGYYIVGEKYSVVKELGESPEEEVKPDEKGEYPFTNVPAGSTLTITIGTARKIPKVNAQVTPRQVFSAFVDTATTISSDSAFTAAFQITNFDPYYEDEEGFYGVYTGPDLTFAQAIPKDTTIILLDRSKSGAKTYWYYSAPNGVTSVPLTDFRKMGGNADEKYTVPHPAGNGYIDLSYQFIVDFSQSASGYSGASLTMTLEASAKEPEIKAPEVKPEVTVSMAGCSFELTKGTENANSLTNSVTCTFTKGAAASKWENRASALILTPETDSLPPDARIKAEIGDETTYLHRSGGSFIAPMSLLQTDPETNPETGTKTVKFTLQSELFPKTGGSYSFNVNWLISPSKSSRAPKVGDSVGVQEVTFVSAEKKAPSLKSTGQQRVLTAKNHLNLEIEMLNMDDYTVSAALLRKSESGTYDGIGWNKANVSQGSLNVPLGGYLPGSYCLMLTVKEQAPSVTIVMEVPYYFVIK